MVHKEREGLIRGFVLPMFLFLCSACSRARRKALRTRGEDGKDETGGRSLLVDVAPTQDEVQGQEVVPVLITDSSFQINRLRPRSYPRPERILRLPIGPSPRRCYTVQPSDDYDDGDNDDENIFRSLISGRRLSEVFEAGINVQYASDTGKDSATEIKMAAAAISNSSVDYAILPRVQLSDSCVFVRRTRSMTSFPWRSRHGCGWTRFRVVCSPVYASSPLVA